ncbi:lipopolysaccharide-induced tumor necrosis factor-alpha factor homolog [Saccoglossus kowalevskii]|uniref:Cell death-inducing p53-target protein 1-like n=1 Tax=Saccoglossus kowalevskii TaxID=10224 RepID=A0ABM0M3S5_SACKO|nr:PREDICTED: cell death-inducing p53-target protein 1-like [Saccoglossus kowalevskii]
MADQPPPPYPNMADQPPPPYPGTGEKTPYPPGPTDPVQPGYYVPPPGMHEQPPQAGTYPQPIISGHAPPPSGMPYTQQPPPSGGAHYQHTSQTVVIAPQPLTATSVVVQLNNQPVAMTCPYCQKSIVSETSFEVGTCAWIACAICCFVGCDAGCCLIPFCMDDFKDCVHRCPSCQSVLGKCSRM